LRASAVNAPPEGACAEGPVVNATRASNVRSRVMTCEAYPAEGRNRYYRRRMHASLLQSLCDRVAMLRNQELQCASCS
jgi:hypothetical protein